MIETVKLDFTLYQGATWEHDFAVTDKATGAIVALTGCTARLEAREDITDATEVIGVDGVVDEVNGVVRFTVTPAMTIGENWQVAGYDAELVWPTGKIDKLAIGKLKLVQEFTR